MERQHHESSAERPVTRFAWLRCERREIPLAVILAAAIYFIWFVACPEFWRTLGGWSGVLRFFSDSF